MGFTEVTRLRLLVLSTSGVWAFAAKAKPASASPVRRDLLGTIMFTFLGCLTSEGFNS
jgi:hypothetical protein